MEYVAENGTVVSVEMLDKMAKEYENGTWTGHGKVAQGRPRIYDEDMETVSFRIPKSRIAAIEAAAKKRGVSKSEFFREAVDRALIAKEHEDAAYEACLIEAVGRGIADIEEGNFTTSVDDAFARAEELRAKRGSGIRKVPVSTFVIVYRYADDTVDVLALVYGPTIT